MQVIGSTETTKKNKCVIRIFQVKLDRSKPKKSCGFQQFFKIKDMENHRAN